MATQILGRIFYACRTGGGAPPKGIMKESSGQSYKAGQMIKKHTDGKVIECTTDDTETLGMALSDASGNEDTDVEFVKAEPDVLFSVNCYHVTPGSAVTAEDDRGKKYGIIVSDNKVYVDKAEVTAKFFQVHDFYRPDANDPVGDTYGRYLVKVLSDVYQLGPGEKTA